MAFWVAFLCFGSLIVLHTVGGTGIPGHNGRRYSPAPCGPNEFSALAASRGKSALSQSYVLCQWVQVPREGRLTRSCWPHSTPTRATKQKWLSTGVAGHPRDAHVCATPGRKLEVQPPITNPPTCKGISADLWTLPQSICRRGAWLRTRFPT